MKSRFFYSVLSVFCFTLSLMAKQEKYVKHTVGKDETVVAIAQKYKVTPYDIYRLNPDSQNGIQPNSVLIIPETKVTTTPKVVQKTTQNTNLTTHLVQPKETFYSIAKQYNVSVESLQNANPDLLKNGLKIGQIIKIPTANEIKNSFVPTQAVAAKPIVKETPKPVVPKPETPKKEAIYHVIQPKETKYAVAKKYGMTIEELEHLNPEIVSNFPVGFKLLISGTSTAKSISGTAKPSVETSKTPTSSTKKYLEEYVVKPKETIGSIATDFGISEQELISLNPELKQGVKQGMILRVPKGQKKDAVKKGQTNLLNTINTNARKQLALLLPFNLNKLESDTINTTQSHLKKDKFLNLTLDFYSGALVAIDSAKVLGLNVDIKILDSQETKNSSNVAALVQQNDLEKMDAIIGPFYQSNVEKLAELIGAAQTPVISPLSKDNGKKYSNLYQSMPSADFLRNSIFDFMKSKNGNILAVIDPKKGSVKQYIQDLQQEVRIVGLDPKGVVVADSLKVVFQKDKMNYVILASESTGMILETTRAMLNLQKEYLVQLVILEPNETLDFEEISLTSLTKLKLLYPSLSRPNESVEAQQFDAKYKKMNKVMPNEYAIRGFDVTFDTLLRLAQEKTFEETVQTLATEQIENKFDYVKNTSAGYSNKGIYILYYDTDLTIKEAL